MAYRAFNELRIFPVVVDKIIIEYAYKHGSDYLIDYWWYKYKIIVYKIGLARKRWVMGGYPLIYKPKTYSRVVYYDFNIRDAEFWKYYGYRKSDIIFISLIYKYSDLN